MRRLTLEVEFKKVDQNKASCISHIIWVIHETLFLSHFLEYDLEGQPTHYISQLQWIKKSLLKKIYQIFFNFPDAINNRSESGAT